MADFSFNEYADMYLTYGECLCNGERAAERYAEKFPNRRHPTRGVFERLDQRVRETGSFLPRRGELGRPRNIRRVALEEEVLDEMENNPTASCRGIAQRLGVSKSTVNRITLDNNLHPFHVTQVQKLQAGDLEKRVNFCHQLLEWIAEDPDFLRKVLWTDESKFTNEGLFNCHNYHHYGEENPLVTRNRAFQNKWSVNVWGGIVGDHVLIYELPAILNGEFYATFLEETLPERLAAEVPEEDAPTWFQHDGAPPHIGMRARQVLDQRFPQRWIGRYGPFLWPPRSPDLTPLDFFLWGFLKEKVYQKEQESVETAVAWTHAAVAMITPEMMDHVRRNIVRRAEACIAAGGGHFEHFL